VTSQTKDVILRIQIFIMRIFHVFQTVYYYESFVKQLVKNIQKASVTKCRGNKSNIGFQSSR